MFKLINFHHFSALPKIRHDEKLLVLYLNLDLDLGMRETL